MLVNRQKSILLILLSSIIFSTPVLANEDWRFRLSPYAWFAGAKGDVGTIPPNSVPVDVSASDAFDDAEASYMFILDAKKQGHGIFVDLFYSDVQSNDDLVPEPINLTLKSVTKTTIFTLTYQYEIYHQNNTVIDLFAGARYWNIDSELKFGGGIDDLAGKKITNDESWVDPMIGVKAHIPMDNSQFYIGGGAGIGGFDIGSDFFYEVSMNVGYQWNKSIGTAIGYRIFEVDYEDDGYIYDMKQDGWQVGLTWAY